METDKFVDLTEEELLEGSEETPMQIESLREPRVICALNTATTATPGESKQDFLHTKQFWQGISNPEEESMTKVIDTSASKESPLQSTDTSNKKESLPKSIDTSSQKESLNEVTDTPKEKKPPSKKRRSRKQKAKAQTTGEGMRQTAADRSVASTSNQAGRHEMGRKPNVQNNPQVRASVIPQGKRRRENESTPPTQPAGTKRKDNKATPQGGNSASYAQTVRQAELTIAIAHMEGKTIIPIGQDGYKAIFASINACMFDDLDDNFTPTFNGMTIKRGVVKVLCNCAETKSWLTGKAARLCEVTQKTLTVCDFDKISWPKKYVVYFPYTKRPTKDYSGC